MKHALTLIALVVLGSCTSQPVILPSQDFSRPTDLTFVCMETFDLTGGAAGGGGAGGTGGDGTGGGGTGGTSTSAPKVLSGQPMRVCHPRGLVDVAQPNQHTFGFLPNSANGTLSVVDADTWSLVNLNRATSGLTPLPLGVLPTQIASSDDGCRLVTANSGSCDLSFVDPAALLAPTVQQDEDPKVPVRSDNSTIVTNVVPRAKNSGRELRIRAGEVTFLPIATQSTGGAPNRCSGDPSHQWQALATFPSCDLVALIDLPSGVIQKAAYTRPTKDGSVELVPLADGEDPVCPVDCGYPPAPDASAPTVEAGAADAGVEGGADATGDGGSEAGAPDAGSIEAGAEPEVAPPPVDPGDVPYVGPGALRPGPIAIIPESGRAYVGLTNAAFVIGFNVATNTLAPSADGGAIALHEGALGASRIRLSIDPYKDKTTGGPPGAFVGNDPTLDDDHRPIVADREYLYVVARDGTLRVVQVAHLPETECETNREFPPDTTDPLKDAACPPVIGPTVRRPGTFGPGIRLPSPPVDIAVADIRPDMPDQSETSVTGAHAWVLSASGAVYLVNIDPVLRRISFVDPAATDMQPVKTCITPTATDCETETPPPPNTLRNRNFLGYTPALDSSSGFARLDVPPAQQTIGPRIESIWTQGTKANATALTLDFQQTEVFFPDQVTVTPQTWTVTWQGNLMNNPRLTGQLRSDSSLTDLGVDFCRLGVEDTDIVTLVGCTADAQCGINKKCVLGSNGAEGGGNLPITGLCLSSANDRPACDDLLSTVKRYDVTTAQTGVLKLAPHKDELVMPALRPCTVEPAGVCGGGSDGGADAGTDAHSDAAGTDAAHDGGAASFYQPGSCLDSSDPSTMGFACVGGRCLYPCFKANETEGCRPGRLCLQTETPLPGGNPNSSEPCDKFECFCADAPPLDTAKAQINTCLGELTAYQVGVGRGFAVAGSQAGLPATGVAGPDGRCTRMTGLDPRVTARISMDDPMCTAPVFPDNVQMLDSRCDPNLSDPGCPMAAGNPTAAKTTAGALFGILSAENFPNACQYIGGPNEIDAPNTTCTHVKAMFRNRELHFGMTNLEHPPSGTFSVRFDVHGGFQPQLVTIPPTVEVTMPARILLGPFDAANPTTGKLTAEVPYLFVVDQRRLGRSQGGGPTRGQLLRIHPMGYQVPTPVTGYAPWFEDQSHSQNLFPIQ
jgi:hypothetical protein